MATTKSAKTEPATLTVKLKTSLRSMVPFDVEVDGVFMPRTAADDGQIVKLPIADATRMIAKGRAVKVG